MRSKVEQYKVSLSTEVFVVMVRGDCNQNVTVTTSRGTASLLSVAKKRGRKPRDVVYTLSSTAQSPKIEEPENIILCLPVNESDLRETDEITIDETNNPLKYDPTPPMHEPSPYSPHVPGSFLDKDTKSERSLSSAGDGGLDAVEHNQKSEQFVDKKSSKVVTNLFVNTDFDSNSICCWWDTEPFTGAAASIPLSRDEDGYKMHGIFCSYNCACAYLFNEPEIQRDKVWSSYSLINLMCKKIFGGDFKKIQMAPPRQLLKKFGGHKDIHEFRRAAVTNNVAYKLLLPPMTMVIPQIEEMTIKSEPELIPVNRHKMAAADESLKVKRSKPLRNNHATLDTFFNITEAA